MNELDTKQLKDISELIIAPIVHPIQEQLAEIKRTLKEMEDLYLANAELGNYVRDIKHSQEICSIDCKNRITILEKDRQAEKSKKQNQPKELLVILQIVVAVAAIAAALKSFGVIK